MTISRYWRSLKTKDFDRIDRADTVVILPLAAIEQHGPHLPLDVDLRINEGIVAAAAERAPENPPFLILPTQAIGFSAEHTAFLGSLTWSPTSTLDLWTTLIGQVAGQGFRRFLLFNTHGGNSDLMRVAAREIRVRHGALAVGASWYRMLDLSVFADAIELEHGIHGGQIETSLMLHLAPETVEMEKADAFTSYAMELADRHDQLSATGNIQFGWMAQDLNRSGAVGDASKATADAGAKILDAAAQSLVDLIAEIGAFDLKAFAEESL